MLDLRVLNSLFAGRLWRVDFKFISIVISVC